MYGFYHYVGGFLWWLFVKFGRTNLSDEQSEANKLRNSLFIFFINLTIALSIVYTLNS